MDNPRLTAPLRDVVDACGMSVCEAENTLVETTKNRGKKIGELPVRAFRFYAGWRIYPHTPEAVKRQIAAARVLYAKYREERRQRRHPLSKCEDDAKHCMSSCNNCGSKKQVPTKIFDRAARPRCWHCGGTLVRDAMLGETMTVAEAQLALRLVHQSIYRLLHTGVLKGFKRGNHWCISRDSVLEYHRLQHANDGKPQLDPR